jgi:hypothetical protein
VGSFFELREEMSNVLGRVAQIGLSGKKTVPKFGEDVLTECSHHDGNSALSGRRASGYYFLKKIAVWATRPLDLGLH